MVIKKRIFSGAVREQLVYNVLSGTKDPSRYDPEKPCCSRFKNEAERMAHRKEMYRRRLTREQLRNQIRQQLHENQGPHFEIIGPLGVVVNPHEMKINAILAKESGKVPIYYTMPRRNGKRGFRSRFLGKFQLQEISFTDKSDP